MGKSLAKVFATFALHAKMVLGKRDNERQRRRPRSNEEMLMYFYCLLALDVKDNRKRTAPKQMTARGGQEARRGGRLLLLDL